MSVGRMNAQMLAIGNELQRQKVEGKIQGFSVRWGVDSKKADVTIYLHAGGVREEIFRVVENQDIETIHELVIARVNALIRQ